MSATAESTLPRSRSAAAQARLRTAAPPFLGMVVVEFLLGISLTLFVTLPKGSVGSILAASPVLDVHILVGVLLLGFSANLVRLSVVAGSRPLFGGAMLGLVSALSAFGAGMDFAFGPGSAAASFAMSLGFVGLLVAAGILLRFAEAAGSAPSVGGSPAQATP